MPKLAKYKSLGRGLGKYKRDLAGIQAKEYEKQYTQWEGEQERADYSEMFGSMAEIVNIAGKLKQGMDYNRSVETAATELEDYGNIRNTEEDTWWGGKKTLYKDVVSGRNVSAAQLYNYNKYGIGDEKWGQYTKEKVAELKKSLLQAEQEKQWDSEIEIPELGTGRRNDLLRFPELREVNPWTSKLPEDPEAGINVLPGPSTLPMAPDIEVSADKPSNLRYRNLSNHLSRPSSASTTLIRLEKNIGEFKEGEPAHVTKLRNSVNAASEYALMQSFERDKLLINSEPELELLENIDVPDMPTATYSPLEFPLEKEPNNIWDLHGVSAEIYNTFFSPNLKYMKRY